MRIGELARRAGVGRETVRFYQRKKLLRVPSSRRAFREYTEEDLRTLQFIRRAKGLGFTLKEIAKLMTVRSRASRDELLAILDAKANALVAKRAEIEMTLRALEHLRAAIQGSPNTSALERIVLGE